MQLESKFKLKQAVYYMKNNRVRKSTITTINFPTVWVGSRGKIEMTVYTYRLKALSREDYGNSDGLPESMLFATKSQLLKTL